MLAKVGSLAPIRTSRHGAAPVYVPPELKSLRTVYLCFSAGTRTGHRCSGLMKVLSGCCAPASQLFFWMSGAGRRSFRALASSPPTWISIAHWWWLNLGVEVVRWSSQLHLLCVFPL